MRVEFVGEGQLFLPIRWWEYRKSYQRLRVYQVRTRRLNKQNLSTNFYTYLRPLQKSPPPPDVFTRERCHLAATFDRGLNRTSLCGKSRIFERCFCSLRSHHRSIVLLFPFVVYMFFSYCLCAFVRQLWPWGVEHWSPARTIARLFVCLSVRWSCLNFSY